MNILTSILPFIAAAIIIIFNKKILDYSEQKYKNENKPFDREKAFLLTMLAAVILILKGVFFNMR